MTNINRNNIFKAFLVGFFSSITIGALTVLTYKTSLGLFIMTSFGSSMVLLYGFPESSFAQPKNIFFGHLLTAFIGILFLNYVSMPIFINISLSVGVGISEVMGFVNEDYFTMVITPSQDSFFDTKLTHAHNATRDAEFGKCILPHIDQLCRADY